MRTIAGVCHYALSPPIRPGALEPGVPRASSPCRQRGGRVNQARLGPDAAPMLRGRADYAQRTPVRRGPVPRTAKMRYPMGAPGRGLPRDLDPSGQLRASDGRLAQRESASFTPRRSLVRSQYRPPGQQDGAVVKAREAARATGPDVGLAQSEPAETAQAILCVLSPGRRNVTPAGHAKPWRMPVQGRCEWRHGPSRVSGHGVSDGGGVGARHGCRGHRD